MSPNHPGFSFFRLASAVLNSWDELRNTFLAANARKAIAPTQFNHQSTRGHCIITIEVLMPDEQDPNMKKRGRVYVCDLAGTEPAGDIYFANYETVPMGDGTTEQKLVGPHADQAKTKELRAQGKKINLSLSEMAQFFMKMANAIKAKKLAPGKSIPGCNSYFLCKYLKDIMLQARTYLFCAIRPEVTYAKYTFATLGFAKNAPVVQLKPKQASVEMSAGERKLMEQLAEPFGLLQCLLCPGTLLLRQRLLELLRLALLLPFGLVGARPLPAGLGAFVLALALSTSPGQLVLCLSKEFSPGIGFRVVTRVIKFLAFNFIWKKLLLYKIFCIVMCILIPLTEAHRLHQFGRSISQVKRNC